MGKRHGKADLEGGAGDASAAGRRAACDEAMPGLERPLLRQVLASAARLQQVVPDAVLVGDSAAALWANHRDSFDHDHVLAELSEHFSFVLEAIESTEGWVTNRVVPDKMILGELGGIESGIRQLIRKVPLEVADAELPSGAHVRVPTPEETLRIKGYLVVRQNQTRDYLDVVALTERAGLDRGASVLRRIDSYYGDQRPSGADGVATQLVRQLADPRPKDRRTTTELARYKGLDPRWADWSAVVAACRRLAVAIGRVA